MEHDKDDSPELSTASESESSASDHGRPLEAPLARSGTSMSNSSENTAHQPRRRLLQSSSSALMMAGTFAPPFYNRPPTPLPPSPSLTSLLRPPFSTTTSRPSTPDDSEIDTLNDAESAVVAKSARIASVVPRASPKVPTYEYYGFVLYLLSSLSFVIYLLWSYLPSPFLRQLGIDYYPNRWWSLAIPSFIVMTLVYIYVALAAYNTGYLTLPMHSLENVVDEAAQIAVLGPDGSIVRNNGIQTDGQAVLRPLDRKKPSSRADFLHAWTNGTDAVMDVPLGGVCEILYGT